MTVLDPDHWKEAFFDKGPKYDKIVEMIAAINASGGIGSHASTHEDLGSDEISVAGLSGLLGDAQTPVSHNNTYHSETYKVEGSAPASHNNTYHSETYATTTQLHSQSHDNNDHTTNYEEANANIQTHVATPTADAHHAQTHNNTLPLTLITLKHTTILITQLITKSMDQLQKLIN